MCAMDAVFALNEIERAHFLRIMRQGFGSTYVCLWSSFPCLLDYLCFLDGYYQQENDHLSGSSGARHFEEYRREPVSAVNNHVPGSAFVNKRPYIELKESELQLMASTDAQLRFYQEASIKIAVFMGCCNGEIELGWSSVPTFNIEKQMADWFQEDFSRHPTKELCYLAVDPNKPLSSSSPVRAVSLENSSLFFNFNPRQEALQEAPPLQSIPITIPPDETIPSTANNPLQAAMPSLHPLPGASSTNPTHQAIQSLQPEPRTFTPLQKAVDDFSLAHDIQLPTPEGEDAAMTKANIPATLISAPMMGASSYSSCFSSSSTHMLPPTHNTSHGATAFRHYRSSLASGALGKAGLRRESMLRRVIAYQRALNNERCQQMQEAARPTSTQLHHMISERKRREKMNESFQALRSLLPLEQAKKDKASVLARTRDYLTSLKTQLEELILQNQQLETQLSVAATETSNIRFRYVCSKENFDVRTIHVPPSTPEERFIDLQITVKEEKPVVHMVIRMLEFLKSVQNVHVISMEARTLLANSSAYNRLVLRLKVNKGNDFDEPAFQEAARTVVAELAK